MKPSVFFLATLIFLSSCVNKATQKSTERIDPMDKIFVSQKSFSKEAMDELKSTTTIFFCKKSRLDSFRQVLEPVWDLTPIIFEDIDNKSKYLNNSKYSFFIIDNAKILVYRYDNSGARSLPSAIWYTFLTLSLSKDIDEKDEIIRNRFCRIELHPDTKTIRFRPNAKKGEDVINKLYNEGRFYNFSPIFLKAQLSVVSTNLKNNMRPYLFQDIKANDLSELLSSDTLYVSDNSLIEFDRFSAKEKPMTKNIFKSYNYKYRICTDKELFDIFHVQKRGRFLFEYAKSITDKFVTIYDLKQKSIIYKKYVPVSFNLLSKDLEIIK